MKESIYTIPISEAFEAASGCPFCAIRRTLELKWTEYITGPAMMEPDVRQETNRRGFCGKHYEMLLQQKNRLSVALMLQTHLADLGEKLTAKPGFTFKEPEIAANCFICEKVRVDFGRILENTVLFWAREPDFHKMYMHQEYVCLPDCEAALKAARKKLWSRHLAEFTSVTRKLASNRLFSTKSDIDAFCKLFDYRSTVEEPPSAEVSLAIERAISFLTGE